MTSKKEISHFFTSRIRALRRMMAKESLDAMLVTYLPNVRYLCNFTGSSGALVVEPDRVIFFSDNRYREQAAAEVFCDDSSIVSGGALSEPILDYLNSSKARRIGFESNTMAYGVYIRLESGLKSRARLVLTEDWVEQLRQTKDSREITLMKKAASIGARALKQTLSEVREGITEIELSRILRDRLEACGGEKLSFDSIVLFGGRTSLIHGKPGNAKLKWGDPILFDFGTTYEGYCSDMTRTVCFGPPSDEVREAYRAVERAQREARQAVAPGRTGKQIDAAARDCLESLGYGDEFSHSTGHSLGLEIHESPRLSDRSKTRLRQGMVVTVEPGVYRPGRYGIRIEDMVVVTKSGSECLTRYPRSLTILS